MAAGRPSRGRRVRVRRRRRQLERAGRGGDQGRPLNALRVPGLQQRDHDPFIYLLHQERDL